MRASWVAGVLSAGAAALVVEDAHAEERDPSVTFVTPGYLFSAVAGHVPAYGHGFELSVLHFFDTTTYRGLGVVGQIQSYNGSHLRVATALEGAYGIFGVELGWAMRRSDGEHASQHGVHVTPYVSIGVVSVGVRTTVPIGGGDAAYGWETGLSLKLAIPVPVRNRQNLGMYLGQASAGGRPLRDTDGVALLPDVVERAGGNDPRDRARWIEQARMEHASVESFLRLADDLDALGAPSTLIARACRAAEEERRHAAKCLELAGGRVTLRPAKRRTRHRPDVARIASEAWHDGVIGEGRAAASLLAQAVRTRDPARAHALAEIAREEQDHARLSADILRFLAMDLRMISSAVG